MKVKVRALRSMYRHARGEEFETSTAHAAALVRVGAASYVPSAVKRRTYKRRDLVPEGVSVGYDARSSSGESAPE